nr:MAG TPA: hypothetical protein [Bacteriophage sp.]
MTNRPPNSRSQLSYDTDEIQLFISFLKIEIVIQSKLP